MRLVKLVITLLLSVALFEPACAMAGNSPALYENAVSDTLDLWRDGRYEQLYDHLAKRGKTSREQFVRKMRDSSIKPACCWQKMEHFRLLNEKKSTATVYLKIGLEGLPTRADSVTREFKLVNEYGAWKMQLSDIMALAGVTKKKHRKNQRNIVRYQ